MTTFAPRYIEGFNSYIKPFSIVIKPEYTGTTKKRTINQIHTISNLSDNSHKGKLSAAAVKRLRTSINWLSLAAKYKQVWVKRERKTFWFKLSFITLTIPSQENSTVSGKKFQAMLNTWLVYARKYYYMSNYVWKVELQQNGMLHVHITTDTFIHWQKVRNSWNKILQKNGLLESFFSKYNHYNPNSTDIHAVYKVGNVAAYISKYMSKDAQLTSDFKGRIWGCSRSLSPNNKCNAYLDAGTDDKELSHLYRSCIESVPIKGKAGVFTEAPTIADLFFVKLTDWGTTIKGKIYKAFQAFVNNIRSQTKEIPKEWLTIDFIGASDNSIQVNSI